MIKNIKTLKTPRLRRPHGFGFGKENLPLVLAINLKYSNNYL